MMGPKTWLQFFIDIIFLQEGAQLSRHNFSKILDMNGRFEMDKDLGSSFGFLIRGLISTSLNGFGTWPKYNEELIILRSGSSATGNNSFNNWVGTGSNKHVVGLDAVISLFRSSKYHDIICQKRYQCCQKQYFTPYMSVEQLGYIMESNEICKTTMKNSMRYFIQYSS